MFQPPIDIPKIIEMTTEMVEKERAIDPFLPETPKLFFERNLTSMLIKALGNDFNENLSHVKLTAEEIVNKLLVEVTERLYNLENENSVDIENNNKDLDSAIEKEIKGTHMEEVAYLKPSNAYQHPEHRFQPPRNIPSDIPNNKLAKRGKTNQSIPARVAYKFLCKALGYNVKKIDQNLFKNGCQRLRQMKVDEIASKLLDAAIEKLYNIEVDIEKENKVMNNSTAEIKDVVIEELQYEEKSIREYEAKKKKWNIRRLFRYFIPCIKKKED